LASLSYSRHYQENLRIVRLDTRSIASEASRRGSTSSAFSDHGPVIPVVDVLAGRGTKGTQVILYQDARYNIATYALNTSSSGGPHIDAPPVATVPDDTLISTSFIRRKFRQ
jgi:hypothetical protein